MNKPCKVLIFGQPFNDFSGGGITLTNLFKGWPKENIAVASYPYMLKDVTWNLCETYYQLGRLEHKWRFPFNIFKQTYKSGLVKRTEGEQEVPHQSKKCIKQFISNMFVNPLIRWLGLTNCISNIGISKTLKDWMSEFGPEILYFQISNRESILFAMNLIDQLKVPSVIHMMDDWPSTISSYGIFKKFWNTRIDMEFRQLLEKVDLYLSISDQMSEEYFRRYHKQFKPFHNPVDIYQFKLPQGIRLLNTSRFRILYVGRIGTANKKTILSFADFVSRFKINNLVVEFDVYSKEADNTDLVSIRKLNKISIKPPVSHNQIPALLKDYDLLLLPLDFNEAGIRFAKFSIPTKASEYMLSGTPILIIAPPETAVARFFSANECGYCVTKQDESEIDRALRFLILNEEYRAKISRNAIELAKERFDGEKVRKEFQELLLNVSKTGK